MIRAWAYLKRQLDGDYWEVDLDRLRQCHIHVVSPDRRVIPFCAYNLTSRDGRPLYRAPIAAREAVA